MCPFNRLRGVLSEEVVNQSLEGSARRKVCRDLREEYLSCRSSKFSVLNWVCAWIFFFLTSKEVSVDGAQ